MTVVTAAELARDIERILDLLEKKGEEVVIVRDDHEVARLVRRSPGMTVEEAFGDLYGRLTDEEVDSWLEDLREVREAFGQRGLRDPRE